MPQKSRIAQLPFSASVTDRIMSPPIKCPQHPDEDLRYYCDDCTVGPICSECILHGIHRNHSVYAAKNATAVLQDRIFGRISEIGNHLKSLSNSSELITESKNDILSLEKSMRNQIDIAFNAVESMISRIKEDLYINLHKLVKEDLRSFEGQEKYCEQKKKELFTEKSYLSTQLDKLDDV